MVCLAQTVHLSCTDPNTISKRTEMRFDLTHITEELHLVCLKQSLSLWYIWHKRCDYLALMLIPSPNGPKQDSIWTTSPRSSIRCVQNNFQANDTFGVKISNIQTNQNELPLEPHHLGVHWVRPKQILTLWYVCRKLCTYLASWLAYLQMDWNELALEPRDLRVPFILSKMVTKPMVRSAQTMHISCTDTNTLSEPTETRFAMTHSPRSSIRCIQNNFRANDTFGANRAPVLHQD
jgi:hypothetical protein